MAPLEVAGLTIFILVLFAGIFSTIFGLPGTIIIFIDVILYAVISGFSHIGIKLLFIMLIITLLAEALDFSLGMAGATRFLPSKQNLWSAAAGALLGGMIMTPLLYGLGTATGAFLGGFCGVLTSEMVRQHRLKPAFRASARAVLMGIAGILVKGFSALAMTIVALSNIYS